MKKEPTFAEIPTKRIAFATAQKKIMAMIEALKAAKTMKEGLPVIKKMERFADRLVTDLTVISIRYSLATNDPHLIKLNDEVDEKMPLLQSLLHMWNKVLVAVPFRKELEEKYSAYWFCLIENNLRVFDEKIIPELVECNKLTSRYDRILGGAEISFRDGVYNLSQMGRFTTDVDQKTRHDASVAVDGWLAAHEEEIGAIYDRLVHLRDTMAKKLGFRNFVELGYLNLNRVDYDAKMVADYRREVSETVVPLCQRLYKKQAKRLGIPFKKMASYDYNVSFLSGNPVPVGDEAVLVKAAREMYHKMSREAGAFFDLMCRSKLLDLTARPGKAPGGYMTFLPLYGYPFIFANFNGTEGDVNVLTHEVGHAFQGYLSRRIRPADLRQPTLEACEIHSMSMEFFAWPYMESFFGKDSDKYLYSHLASAVEFFPYGISIDEFQHWVYENPEKTHQERCAKFKEIQERYEPHKRYVDMPCAGHGAWWIRQSHVFTAPFYYIDYTLAQTVAMEFFLLMRRNHERAWRKYVRLCKCGGKYPFVELLKRNHLHDPFIKGNVKKIVAPAAAVLRKIDISGF